MPINFFTVGCKTESNENTFGLCDNPPPAVDPAYIDEANSFNWIAEVSNPHNINVDFFAVDHCVEVLRANGQWACRCDGILLYNNKLSFIELKDRGSSGWISGGRGQLTETVSYFIANHNITAYTAVDARICNKQRPLAVVSSATEIQKFKDDTGLLLIIDRNILV